MTSSINPSWKLNQVKFKNSPLLPSNVRAVVLGSSGSGKTFRVFNMLLQPDFLDYDTLHVFSPSLHQDEYRLLISGLKNRLTKKDITLCIEGQNELGVSDPESLTEQYARTLSPSALWTDVQVYGYKSVRDVPQPETLKKGRRHMLVFDDCMSGPQETLENFYTRGRHMNCNCIYLTQSWFELPRRTIRSNSNVVILFPVCHRDLKLIYNDLLESQIDLTQQEFITYCSSVWDEPYKFVLIDRFNKNKGNRLRCGFENNLDSSSI